MDKNKYHLLPSLEKLYYSVRVAEVGSISQAAKILHKSQSSISRSISLLELDLGIRIFERKKSGVLLRKEAEPVIFRTQRALKLMVEQLKNMAHVPTQILNEKRLEVFLELEKLHHMPSVANLLNISQPAISQTIRLLEQGLKQKLFIRNQEGLSPSKFAQEFALQVRMAMNELRNIRPEIAHLDDRVIGAVHIGALPLSRGKILPSAIIQLHKRYPDINFVTIESPFEDLAKDLRSGDLDFIIGALREPEYASDFNQQSLISESLSIVARKGHPYTNKKDIREIINLASWIFPRKKSPSRVLIDQLFSKINMTIPQASIETGDLAIIRGILLETDMLAIVSSNQLIYEINRGEIIRLDINLPRTDRLIGITTRKNSFLSPAAQLLIKELEAQKIKSPKEI